MLLLHLLHLPTHVFGGLAKPTVAVGQCPQVRTGSDRETDRGRRAPAREMGGGGGQSMFGTGLPVEFQEPSGSGYAGTKVKISRGTPSPPPHARAQALEDTIYVHTHTRTDLHHISTIHTRYRFGPRAATSNFSQQTLNHALSA